MSQSSDFMFDLIGGMLAMSRPQAPILAEDCEHIVKVRWKADKCVCLPFARILKIDRTKSSLSFDHEAASPRSGASLPFLTLSWTLSIFDPMNM
jgi:hypothetical protein